MSFAILVPTLPNIHMHTSGRSTRFLVLGVVFAAIAGTALLLSQGSPHFTASLIPTDTTGTASGYTLQDVWNKITNNTYTATNGGYATSPSDTPSAPTSLKTVDDIYNAILPIDASKMLNTLTVQGVTGSIPTQTFSASTHSVAAGYYAATDLTTVDPRLAPGNIAAGTTIFGVTGTATGSGSQAWYTYGSNDPTTVLTSATRGGTYDAVNLSGATVKSGVSFGVGQTGAYPSALYPLAGNGTGTPAAAANILTGNYLWSATGAVVQGGYNAPTAANVENGVSFGVGQTGTYPSTGNPLPTTGATGTPATTANILSNYFALSTTGAVIQGSATAGGPAFPSCAPSGTYPNNTDNCAATAGSHYSFATDANGVLEVADSATNLIWTKCPLGQTGSGCSGGSTLKATLNGSNSQPPAEADCEALNTGGVTGWRLPTFLELITIVNTSTFAPAINLTFFPNTPPDGDFWSSSPYVINPGLFWDVYFIDGGTSVDYPSSTFDVRCVRPAK